MHTALDLLQMFQEVTIITQIYGIIKWRLMLHNKFYKTWEGSFKALLDITWDKNNLCNTNVSIAFNRNSIYIMQKGFNHANMYLCVICFSSRCFIPRAIWIAKLCNSTWSTIYSKWDVFVIADSSGFTVKFVYVAIINK